VLSKFVQSGAIHIGRNEVVGIHRPSALSCTCRDAYQQYGMFLKEVLGRLYK